MKTLIAAALLIGSATPALAQESYRAVGTEPFWSLTIDAQTMKLEQPGQIRPNLTVNKPRPIIGINGERYDTPRLSVDITHVKCNDGMSDRIFRDTVRIVTARGTLRGCGGPATGGATVPNPSAALLEGDWKIERIGGQRVSPQTDPSISFRNGRISGNASCNRFSGGYSFSYGRLRTGPIASTRMACALRVQNVQESSILNLLGQPLSVSGNRNGKLVLSTRAGATLTLVRSGRR